jgi:sodium-dependent dicarboxylate transporter 2/3/5
MEIKESLTPAEERFERVKKTAGLIVGPVAFLALYLIPFPPLSAEAHGLLAVVGLVLVFWLTEALPLAVTALLGAGLNAVLGVAPAVAVFSPFADQIVFLFIGSFILAEAIMLHGLDRRFAFAIMSLKGVQASPMRLLLAVGAISACLSMWISNTAATAMMFPIGLGVLNAMGDDGRGEARGRWDFAPAVMLMVAYGASIGGIATPVGTPPNLIGIGMIDRLIGVKISFFEWMVFALPITVVMFVCLSLVLGWGTFAGFGGETKEIKIAAPPPARWTRGQKNTAFVFFITVFLWIFPSVFSLLFGEGSATGQLLAKRLDIGIVAIFAAVLLFVLPIDAGKREFTMNWERASRIDWGTILLFGGGLSLGSLMFSTGLANAFGHAVTGFTGASTLWGITAVGTIVAIIMSETTSNTASANMVIPVMIAVAEGAGVSPLPPALGACLGASFGFMLPVSTPPNAIVYGSGLVPILTMVKKGVVFDAVGFIIIMGGLMILCPLLGLV